MITPYQMTINNCAAYLNGLSEQERTTGRAITAFTMSETLSIAFCKAKEEIVEDIVEARKNV